MTNDDLAAMSGETTYRGSQLPTLNEVSLNGDADKEEKDGKLVFKGGYFRKRLLLGATKGEKPNEFNLGETINVVFLKIRRKLVERGKDGKILRSTSEHNSKKDAVKLFDSKSKDPIMGVADDLRARFPGLRTVQIVYALLLDGTTEPELVKLTIKGASLGSEAKAESVMSFYDYLSSFKSEDHMYEYKTVLKPVLEEGNRKYFAIDFQRGDKLTPKGMEYAAAQLREIHAKCVEVDAARAAKIADGVVVAPSPEAEMEFAQEIETQDINPDDIPF
jgi:hypothetical protein